jgi:predicted MFS family arabinose efflux permease
VGSPARLFFRVTLPLAALNVINQASRTVMAIIGPLLAVEFGLSASELGLLAACMFASYGLVQLPLGVALDLVGPRRVQATLALVAAAGFAVFALSDGFGGFALARVVIGVGVSAGLMAILKVNAQWFAPAQVANMTGIAMAVGGLGSVLTTSPVQAALPHLGWRGVFWLLCGLSLATSAWIWFSVRDKPAAARRRLGAEFAVMGPILRSGVFWRFAPAMVMLSVANFAYLGLWAGPWLRDVAGYDGAARAQTLLWYTIAMIAGGLAVGQLASRLQAKGYPVFLVPALCIFGLLAAKVGLMLQPTDRLAVTALWIAFSAFAAGGATGYVAIGQMFPPELTGRVSTAANMLTLVGAFLLQSAIGWILDLWPRTAAGGWDPRGYTWALALSAALHLVLALRLAAALRRGRAA